MSEAASGDEPSGAPVNQRRRSRRVGLAVLSGFRPAWSRVRRVFTPSPAAWAAATWGLVALWALIILSFMADIAGHFSTEQTLGLATLVLVLVLVSLAILFVAWLLAILDRHYRRALLLSLPPAVLVGLATWGPGGGLLVALIIVLGLSLFLGSLAALRRRGEPPRRRRVGAMAFLAVGAVVLGAAAFGYLRLPPDPNPALAHYHLANHTLPLPDPAASGPYAVSAFTYGSGKDRWRPEYGAHARFLTRSVDGSKIDEKWTGAGGWLRGLYWGFGSKAFPVQGRVWAPDFAAAKGPFPLVLIVHGNHQMEAFSDPGYAYLGRRLASQGFIVVSVDENFLNSSMDDFINPFATRTGQENAVRGWMLLEHLVQWRAWNADRTSPLYGKVDMSRIGLIGHSRGGEAVAIANAFNDLDAYPDDATVPFDFHFKIGAVAAIAPVDGQYKPRTRPVPMRDTNYFVLQGSMDGDLTSFMGSSQYSRAKFSGDVHAFKASLYIKGANHGQFNTAWGRYDDTPPFKFLLDARPIMDPAAQRRIAATYLAAFLQATLNGKDAYRPLFEDARNGAAWLPDVFLVNNYADSDTRWLADYRTLDPTKGASPDVTISGRNLSVWRDTFIKLKSTPMDAYGAVIAWDDRVHRGGASYRLDFGGASPKAGPETSLVFALADAGVSTLPKGFHPKGGAKTRKAKKPGPVDFGVVVTDAAGVEARLPLSHDQLLYPQVKSTVRRLAALNTNPASEIVLRRYRFALKDFAAANPRLDLARLRQVRFDFDASPRGAIVVNDIGLTDGP
jgi:dienelactone hydrolase